MHIGFVLPYLEKGGTEEHAITLMRYLAERGLKISLVAPQGPRDVVLEHLPARRFRFTRIDQNLRKGVQTYRAAIRTMLASAPPDLLHVHGAHELLVALPREARFIPKVFTNHGYHGFAKSLSYRTAAWICNRMVERSIAVSRYEEGLMRRFGFSEDRLRLIYNGITDPQEQKPLAEHELGKVFSGASFYVGAVSRLEAAKGIEYLIKAMARLKGEPIVCIIIGDGSLRSHLEQLALDLDVVDSVFFVGYVPSAAALIHRFDVLVVPSLEEPFGLVCVEGMACGKPVIASRVGGIPEIVVHDETGLLVPAADDEALAEAIRTLHRDEKLRERLGHAGRQRYLQLFSVERMGEAVLAIYEEVLSGVPVAERR